MTVLRCRRGTARTRSRRAREVFAGPQAAVAGGVDHRMRSVDVGPAPPGFTEGVRSPWKALFEPLDVEVPRSPTRVRGPA